jgi:hypothetical protein
MRVLVVSKVVSQRGGKAVSGVVTGTLEDIVDPKSRLIRILAVAKLPYDPEMCRQIAHEIRIETLKYRCPSFVSFADRVTNC